MCIIEQLVESERNDEFWRQCILEGKITGYNVYIYSRKTKLVQWRSSLRMFKNEHRGVKIIKMKLINFLWMIL